MLNRTSSILATLLLWHTSLWLASFLLWGLWESLLTWLFERIFGNPQPNHDLSWLIRASGYSFITIGIPTLISIPFFDRCLGSRPRFSLRIAAGLIWGTFALALFAWTFNSNLASFFREWDHFLFGIPENPYSSRNLVPNLLAVTTATLPLGGIILRNYAQIPCETIAES